MPLVPRLHSHFHKVYMAVWLGGVRTLLSCVLHVSVCGSVVCALELRLGLSLQLCPGLSLHKALLTFSQRVGRGLDIFGLCFVVLCAP